jgi:hypothetical protein
MDGWMDLPLWMENWEGKEREEVEKKFSGLFVSRGLVGTCKM